MRHWDYYGYDAEDDLEWPFPGSVPTTVNVSDGTAQQNTISADGRSGE